MYDTYMFGYNSWSALAAGSKYRYYFYVNYIRNFLIIVMTAVYVIILGLNARENHTKMKKKLFLLLKSDKIFYFRAKILIQYILLNSLFLQPPYL